MDTVGAVNMIARFEARDGMAHLLKSRLQEMVRLTLVEPGCVRYELYQLEDAPSKQLLIEQWASQRSLDKHMETDHVRALVSDLPSLMSSDIDIVRLWRL